jgi:tryptophanyl-tRNA synthetase
MAAFAFDALMRCPSFPRGHDHDQKTCHPDRRPHPGPLHIGHYAGSLLNRLRLQDSPDQYPLLADTQALTDHAHDPAKVRHSVMEVALDYLAVGIDPAKSTICLQSHLPALAELSMLYLNFVTVARLERNPTIKDEIRMRGFGRNVPAGFLCYPAAQVADITAFRATRVPVGAGQAPLIEQTNEIVRRINAAAGKVILPEAEAVIPTCGRLPGIDGKSKMSKSGGNAIPLTAIPIHSKHTRYDRAAAKNKTPEMTSTTKDFPPRSGRGVAWRERSSRDIQRQSRYFG